MIHSTDVSNLFVVILESISLDETIRMDKSGVLLLEIIVSCVSTFDGVDFLFIVAV